MSRQTPGRLLALMVCVTCAGCLSDDERQTINTWLTCEECSAGERQAAVAVGWKAVPRLAGALHTGPSAQRMMNTERQIRASWNRLASPRLTLQETVDTYVENYQAVYRARAALALGDIGRSGTMGAKRARDELREALARDSADWASGGTGVFRPDVAGVIGGALAGSITVADGDGQKALPGTAVATAPTVLVIDAAGDPVRGAPVAFEVATGGGSLGSIQSTTDAAGRASAADWILGPAVGINSLTASTQELPPLAFTASAEPPSITSLVPASGQVGTRVRVTGVLLADPIALTVVTLNGVNVDQFVVSADRDSVVILMPLAGGAGNHPLIVEVAGNASAGAGWQQVGMQEAGEPANDNAGTAPLVSLPLDAVGTFNGGDEDDLYNITLPAAATLVIDLDWDAPVLDLDVVVLDNPVTAAQCIDGATGARPELAVCALPAGSYSIHVNDFSASNNGDLSPVSYRLSVREQ